MFPALVPPHSAPAQSPLFASRLQAAAPKPSFGNSDAIKLIEQGNPQQAIVNLVEDLKETAARPNPDLYKTAKIHTFLAKAFQRQQVQAMTDGNEDELRDSMWKLNVHALEANRLWGILGRPDWLDGLPVGSMPAIVETKDWAFKELQGWFQREGRTYLPEAANRFYREA